MAAADGAKKRQNPTIIKRPCPIANRLWVVQAAHFGRIPRPLRTNNSLSVENAVSTKKKRSKPAAKPPVRKAKATAKPKTPVKSLSKPKAPAKKTDKAKTKAKPAAKSKAKPAPPAKPKHRVAQRTPAAKAAPKPATPKSPAPHPLAKQPVRLYQIFYDDWHEQLIDPALEPYDNRGVKSELFEFDVFEKLAKSDRTRGAEYWGALSWRFGEKTGMSGQDLRAAIAANPGFDVYYCNPFPANEAVYHNAWVQGEPSHPSFLALATAFFQAAGLPVERLTSIQTASSFSAANYLIGKPAFWSAYIQFVRKALATAERKMHPKMRALLHSKIADQHSFHFGATYVPFIVERLLDTFLHTEGAGLKAFKIVLPAREQELNVHQKLLREMKDVAHKTKSNWLAAIWVNYRSLYLTQTNGREWTQKYLRAITPPGVKFG